EHEHLALERAQRRGCDLEVGGSGCRTIVRHGTLLSAWVGGGGDAGRRSVRSPRRAANLLWDGRRPSGRVMTAGQRGHSADADPEDDRGGWWDAPAYPVGRILRPLVTRSGHRPRPMTRRSGRPDRVSRPAGKGP